MVMAHGLNSVLKRGPTMISKGASASSSSKGGSAVGIGSRRIFPPHFKLKVLDSYRNDSDCKGNQRATARKYGIHRRQIQKWLQAEANLRSSVTSINNNNNCGGGAAATAVLNGASSRKGICGEASLSQHRQRDDLPTHNSSIVDACCAVDRDAYSQGARVPSTNASAESPPQSLGASGNNTIYIKDEMKEEDEEEEEEVPTLLLPRCPSAPNLPMDLSVKRASSAPVPQPSSSSSPFRSPSSSSSSCSAPESLPEAPNNNNLALAAASSSPQMLVKPDPDVWDLSNKSPPPIMPPIIQQQQQQKPLFKPYLLDDKHLNNNNNNHINNNNNIVLNNNYEYNTYHEPKIVYRHFHHLPPHLNNNGFHHSSTPSIYYNSNSNINNINNNNGVLVESSQPLVGYVYDESGVLQPTVQPNHRAHTTSPYARPTHGSSNSSSPVPNNNNMTRQSYTLDFKLRAIQSYYQDEYCRGNQRAVASKFNIHRRQVQKWLKQEDQLRERNEKCYLQAT